MAGVPSRGQPTIAVCDARTWGSTFEQRAKYPRSDPPIPPSPRRASLGHAVLERSEPRIGVAEYLSADDVAGIFRASLAQNAAAA